jgi:hypothetical protein
LPDVIRAFRAAGGTATLKQVYRWIQSNRPTLPTEWESAIRACIYAHSSDAGAFIAGNPDVFFNESRGVWGLRHPDDTVLGKTDQDFFTQVLVSMSEEEFKPYSGSGNDLIAEVKRRANELKKKYGAM